MQVPGAGAVSRRESGQELVELALVLPLLLLLILGILEFSVVVFSYHSITGAAREGARYGILLPDDQTGIEAAARSRVPALDQSALTVAVGRTEYTIGVTVTYALDLMLEPVIEAVGGNSTLNLRSAATMYLEQP
jgi:Flp pilus assembly protein TadG